MERSGRGKAIQQRLNLPSKHTGSDPKAFWLRPVMAITASVQPESARIVYARSDFPHQFQFRFSKEGMDHTVRNRPRSDLDGLVRVWPNASGLEASPCTGIIWPGFWQDATGPLPVSHFQTRFRSSTDVPDDIVQHQPGSNLVLADCVRFWPNGSGPEASQCARIIRPACGQCFAADPDRFRLFTGYVKLQNKTKQKYHDLLPAALSYLKHPKLSSQWLLHNQQAAKEYTLSIALCGTILLYIHRSEVAY